MSEKVQLLLDGVKLMVMGMVAVYVFLILMVFLMDTRLVQQLNVAAKLVMLPAT